MHLKTEFLPPASLSLMIAKIFASCTEVRQNIFFSVIVSGLIVTKKASVSTTGSTGIGFASTSTNCTWIEEGLGKFMADALPHLLVQEEGSKREEGPLNPASTMLCFNPHRIIIKMRERELLKIIL